MNKTKTTLEPSSLPPHLRHLLDGATVYDSSCGARARVLYLDTGYYLKLAAPGSLSNEAELGRLLYPRGLSAEVVDYVRTAERDILVTREVPGCDLTHICGEPLEVCRLMALALRGLHEQTTDGLPVARAQLDYAGAVRRQLDGKRHVSAELCDYFGICDDEQTLRLAREGISSLSADTLIHGDACLPNVIQASGRLSGFIDLGGAGVGDRHIDLYWAVWSLWYNLGTADFSDAFLDMYGRDRFSAHMLRAMAAIEELFEASPDFSGLCPEPWQGTRLGALPRTLAGDF